MYLQNKLLMLEIITFSFTNESFIAKMFADNCGRVLLVEWIETVVFVLRIVEIIREESIAHLSSASVSLGYK